MLKVYKTNIQNRNQAKSILKALKQQLPSFKANFDFEDCDRILRIKNPSGEIDDSVVIRLIESLGITMDILPDTVQSRLFPDLQVKESFTNWLNS